MLPWPSEVPKVLHIIISAYFFFFRVLLFSFSFYYQHGASTKVNSWRWTGNWEFTEKDSSWRNRWNIDWKPPRPSIASLNPVAYTEFRCNGKSQNIATLFRAYDVRLFSGRKATRIMQMKVLSELSLLRQSALKATTIVHYPYLRSFMVQIRFRAQLFLVQTSSLTKLTKIIIIPEIFSFFHLWPPLMEKGSSTSHLMFRLRNIH